MARGWESKSVESQQQEAAAEASSNGKARLTPAEAETKRKRDSLLLSRRNVEQKIATAANPRYRQMLEAALAELDAKIKELG
jgi:hypothetical protein